ncbi:MAG: hypothetical protein JSV49_07640 [Thermoplasmata archaeon]|nr:MAG: hypothetical protein JSV49_07640 [Thermoplasmata archaeon]
MKSPTLQLNIFIITALIFLSFLLPALTIAQSNHIDNIENTSVRSEESRADYDFSIYFPKPSVLLPPEIQTRIHITIENLGTKSDTYTLEIKQVPVNWTAMFDNGEVIKEKTVGSGSDQPEDIFITPPQAGEAYITVTATSKSTGTGKTVGLTLTVQQPAVQIDIDHEDKTLRPGEAATFTMKLTNLKDSAVQVTISLSALDLIFSETPPDDTQWTYNLNTSRIIDLEFNSSIMISIYIYAPNNVLSNAKRDVVIEAVTDSTEDLPVEKTITVTVLELNLVEATLDPAKGFGKPGQTLDFKVTLFNNGTGDLENVALIRGTLPPSWDVIYNESIKYPLDRFDTRVLTFKVSIPGMAIIGSYKLPMDIRATDKLVGNFTIIVDVLQVAGIELDYFGQMLKPGTDELRYFVNWMQDSEVDFILKNMGNGPDTIFINFSNVPDNWQVYFKCIAPTTNEDFTNVSTDFSTILDLFDLEYEGQKLITKSDNLVDSITVLLQTGSEVRITLGVNTSYEAKSQYDFDYNFTVNTYSSDISVMNSITLEIFLIRSELVVKSVTLSKPVPRVDDVVTVSVEIENKYHITAVNVSVELFISDKSQGVKFISEIPVNGTKTVEFEWTPAKKGLYVFDVELSGPAINPITEPDKSRNFTVEEKSSTEEKDERNLWPIFLVIGVIVVFAMLAVVMLYIQRQKLQRLKEIRKEEYNQKKAEEKENGEEERVQQEDMKLQKERAKDKKRFKRRNK